MSHNVRIATDSQYVDGLPPPGSGNWWKAIDVAQAASVNGVTGGTSSPSTPIQIGGAGLRMDADLTLAGGATLLTPFGSGARITLDKSIPHLSPQRIRTIVTSCGRFIDLRGASTATLSGIHYATVAVAAYSHVSDHVSSARPGMHILLPIRIHDGSAPTQYTLQFSVVGGHVALPEQLPRCRIISVDASGNVTHASTDGSGIDNTNGWATVPTLAGIGSWNSTSQTITGICLAGPDFARSTSRTYAEIYDENGPSALGGNKYMSISLNAIGIGDLRFQ